jgi:hypothetical protein
VIAGSFALAAIAVAISLFNLLLILGIVRRMREMGPMISADYLAIESGPQPGMQLPEFVARTTGGDQADRSTLSAGRGLVAFLSTGCSACRGELPQLRDYVAKQRVDPAHSFVFISGDPAGESDYATTASAFAQVVVEESDGPLARIFDIKAFPTVLALRDGRVQANAPSVSALHLEAARSRHGA